MRTRRQSRVEPLIFFLDRSLGRYDVAEGLQQHGVTVHIHDDHFAPGATDEEWLSAVGPRGWIVLTKDTRIRYRAVERMALMQAGVRAFVLGSSNLSAREMSAAFVRALPAIERFVRSLRVLIDAHNDLEAVGVAIKSATEPFDSSPPLGKFLFQLLGSMAELERSTIIERMNLGRDRITRRGRWLHGPIPYGYQLDDAGCLCPSERLVEVLGITEAALVRDLFLRVQDGSSATQEA